MELTFLKELMSIKQVNQKNVMFVTIVFFLDKGFKFQTYVCSGCHDLLIISTNLDDIAILNIHGADCCCIISEINKSKAVNLL